MRESIPERYGRWRLGDLLRKYPGLKVVPSRGEELTLAGKLAFRVQGPAGDPLEDSYAVRLCIPVDFPAGFPTAREVGGRIPADFHKLDDGSLCLGAPTEIQLTLTLAPTLITFVERLVIPYLFGYSYFALHGTMPFDELDHGSNGLRQHFASLFGISTRAGVDEIVLLTSLRKRSANKQPCPCGSGRRLGRCHNGRVNHLRDRLGRRWFRGCYADLTGKEE